MLIKDAIMGLVTQLYLLFAGFIAVSQCLSDDAITTPEPSVFDMKPPIGFMKLFPMKDDQSENPVRFHFWSSNINNEDMMKFPDWFHYTETTPETEVDVKVEKNSEKAESEDSKNQGYNHVNWKKGGHDMFAYINEPREDKFDAKDVFPPYYNVFLSNAYPSWMAMPGFTNDLKKEKDGIKEEPQHITISAVDLDHKVLDEEKVLPENEEEKSSDDIQVKKLSEPLPDDANIRISKNIKNINQDVKNIQPTLDGLSKDNPEQIKVDPHSIVKETKEVPSLMTKLDESVSKSNTDGVIVPVQVMANTESLGSNFDNIMFVPIDPSEKENKQAHLITPHSSEEKLDSILSDVNIEKKSSSENADQNEDWKKMLYNLLQNAKPMFASMTGSGKDLSNEPKQAAMLIPLKDNPKPKGRSITLDNNVVINNADNPLNIDHNMNASPSVNLPNSPNGAMPIYSQNVNPQNVPNTFPINQGNRPNSGAFNQNPNINQGNIPSNQNIYAQYGSANPNNNYMQNSGQPVLLAFPYNPNNVPQNYGQQGNLNGQTMQANPGTNQMPNNFALVSPGYPGYNSNNMSPGQNIYALFPYTNTGNGMNSSPNTYMNSNPQANANGYQVAGSLPVYNLVPVNKVMNTKDEED